MKASRKFSILVDSTGNRIPGFVGLVGKEIVFNKGDEVPDRYVLELLQTIPDYLDLKKKDGVPVIPAADMKTYESALITKKVKKGG